jgi:hypothetical protein
MRTRLAFLHQLWCALTPGGVRPLPRSPALIVARVQNGVVEHFDTAGR